MSQSNLEYDFGADFAPDTPNEPETISPGILQASAPPKIGNRFSSESVKILRNWFATHERHPYPTIQEVQDLQEQTGLNRQQVVNWFANARRRAKVHLSRPTSPMFRNDDSGNSSGHHTPIDTPRRRGTPAPFEHMNPLQRWANSPPEHEAATVDDITRAVAAFSNRQGRSRSNGSSISSRGTSVSSHDSGSYSSAHSRHSSTSFDIFKRHSRRRRTKMRRQEVRTNLQQTQNTYQCTFCTETFKTKYDWQRHEKSLHLSLENWVCSPNGPTAVHPEEGLLCVFCGIKNPDKTHLDSHNQSACIERPIEERTYHRKDHLQQHLRLVHMSKFLKWPMDEWKVTTQEIRSRCGFCGIDLKTWASRVDHLADHFKAGSTMEHWKGDWGFEAKIIDRIDNAMPPSSSTPSWLWDIFMSAADIASQATMRPTKQLAESRLSQLKINGKRNIFENCELEGALQQYMSAHTSMGHVPSDSELQQEACNVLNRTETSSTNPSRRFLDFLMRLVWSSTLWLGPLRQRASALMSLTNETLDESYFLWDGALPLDASMDLDMSLQGAWMAENRSLSPEGVPELPPIPLTPDPRTLIRDKVRTATPFFINDNNSYRRLKRELSRFVMTTLSPNNPNRHIPSDDELKYQARWILYDDDDPWNQTPVDNAEWLQEFKRDIGLPT
ncbi:hypothetical protein KAF25_009652 [Fusarium avenaceum]|uniref:Monocarboxylate transporter 4 n=1 Tax=Fusarium avenaceum TaxID=40199 RepID=A0A9P7HIC3_9HYPO|nr:hypothetical protein KAF25_009652 [Fusarium avenaceum]